MIHVTELASATDLPVGADLENGYGDSPETVVETIRLAAAAGLSAAPSKMPRAARPADL